MIRHAALSLRAVTWRCPHISKITRSLSTRPTATSTSRSVAVVQPKSARLDAGPKFSTFYVHDSMHDADQRPNAPNNDLPSLDFDSPYSAHGTKTTADLLRAIVVYELCRIRPLVENADIIIKYARNFCGDAVTNFILDISFFRHFCCGKDEESIRPTITSLKEANIGAILDYAAENEGDGNGEPNRLSVGECITSQPPYNQPARLYAYESESDCDRRVETFLSCIRSVRDVSPEGFAALKVTALGNPLLLERLSTAITEAKSLLAKFDLDGDGVVTKDEFAKAYRHFFTDADDKLPELVNRLDPYDTNAIDYIEWSKLLAPADLPRITANCKEIGPLALACPSSEEIGLMDAMLARLHILANGAADCGVRLLIDAEQYKFQPAIDNIVLDLQQQYNAKEKTDSPVIFNTYQCYLKDTPDKIKVDLERSRRFSYHFGTKLVRGAYMFSERERAKAMGYPSPIHDTIEDTHACYDDAVEFLLRYQSENDIPVEFMCASHNQSSIERTIELMHRFGVDMEGKPTVHFAQLYGMSDNLTYSLGRHGYRAYKYVPYGKVHEVMPYLMRRAQENSGMLGNSASELDLLFGELKRRVFE